MKPAVSPPRTSAIMVQVTAALLPGAAALYALFGTAVALQLTVGVLAAVAAETAALALRRQPVGQTLQDGSAVVTGVIVALALPPDFPLYATAIGVVLGLWLGKHAYGGLGHNVFNPAMVGYALLLLAEPAAIAQWPAPDGPVAGWFLNAANADAWTHATPLAAAEGAARAEAPGTAVWIALNGAFALGGLYLTARGLLDRRLPVGALAGLIGTALLIQAVPGTDPLPAISHIYLGATALVIFFVVTDPVSAPADPRARWVYAVGIGATTAVIREWGAHPDGWAYAILIFNATAPLLDRLLRPGRGRTSGRAP